MKKIILFSFLFVGFQTIAQVGIGTTTPDASAKLQIDATDKGFLPPRVALSSLTDQTTIATPAEGLLVYCTGTAGLAEGYYYWEGATWVKMANTANSLDMGYVLAWPSNATPPGYLLPLSGGTYNWADYPEFQTFNSTYASQFISSSNGTTFTLKNINSTGRFLRGSSTAGTDQVEGTKLPTVPFAVSTAGAHVHSVDPPSTTSNTDGSHSHTYNDAYFAENRGLAGNNRYGTSANSDTDNNFIWRTNTGSHSDYASDINTSSSGSHSHSTDISAFNSASNGDHTHTISGGDTETRPINTSVIWVLKVKPTATTGNLTINNTYAGATSASNGVTLNSNNIKLGGTLTEATTINKNGNNLNLSGSGNVVITGDVTATGTIRSAAAGQVLNITMLPPNATGAVLVNSSSFTNVAQVTYTPVSSNSFILIEYATAYEIPGSNTDSFQSEINIAGTQITYGYQQYTGTAGGGGRSGSLFPLMGRYTNSATTAITINVNARRILSDDNFSVYRDASSWFKITEIAR
jgi:hypothetical protein